MPALEPPTHLDEASRLISFQIIILFGSERLIFGRARGPLLVQLTASRDLEGFSAAAYLPCRRSAFEPSSLKALPARRASAGFR